MNGKKETNRYTAFVTFTGMLLLFSGACWGDSSSCAGSCTSVDSSFTSLSTIVPASNDSSPLLDYIFPEGSQPTTTSSAVDLTSLLFPEGTAPSSGSSSGSMPSEPASNPETLTSPVETVTSPVDLTSGFSTSTESTSALDASLALLLGIPLSAFDPPVSAPSSNPSDPPDLLDPAPEPSTVVLVGGALLLLAGFKKVLQRRGEVAGLSRP
jgi:hypothetical protein